MDKNEAARFLGELGGKASGAALSPEQRRARASNAGRAASEKMTSAQRRERARKGGLAKAKKDLERNKPD